MDEAEKTKLFKEAHELLDLVTIQITAMFDIAKTGS